MFLDIVFVPSLYRSSCKEGSSIPLNPPPPRGSLKPCSVAAGRQTANRGLMMNCRIKREERGNLRASCGSGLPTTQIEWAVKGGDKKHNYTPSTIHRDDTLQ
uniref:Uncharacterized protein n=1 Tax=Timema bartmani TaxID=61472 RepID=A0A7R9I591_9NEOP|nr:unnamed protein product [Timema bartmani]